MTCPICGWHPGFNVPPTESQRACPRVHTYKPDPRTIPAHVIPPEEPMPDETDELIREACLTDDPDDTTRVALSEMALSALLEVADVALKSAGGIDATVLDLHDLVAALNRLRGLDQPGIISQLQMVQRDLENAIVTKLPHATRGQRAAKGMPEKWTEIDGFKLEHSTAGAWHIDSQKALTRLFSDVPPDKRDPKILADIVVNHIGSIDSSWRTTELEESLGGPIMEPLIEDGQPVTYKSGPRKGEPKLIKRNRLLEEEWGERAEGRDSIRIHKGDTDGE